MILVDTSIWVDHFRRGDRRLAAELEAGQVLVHPFVLGELACGRLDRRAEILQLLKHLPAAHVATADETLVYIEANRLVGRGIGYVDVHLLASTALSPGTALWTRDRRLEDVARRKGCAFESA